jgi:hypothetical protein
LCSALVAESGVGTIFRLASMADHDRATVRRAYSSADIGKQAGISSDMGSPVDVSRYQITSIYNSKGQVTFQMERSDCIGNASANLLKRHYCWPLVTQIFLT